MTEWPEARSSIRRLRAAIAGLRNEWRRDRAVRLMLRYLRHQPHATLFDRAKMYEACKEICGVDPNI